MQKGFYVCIALAFIVSLFAFSSPSASAHTYPDGTLIRLEGDFKIYTILKNKRRWIKNVEVFKSYGYKWENILVIPPVYIEDMPMNNLVRQEGDIKVYAINDAGYKRHISNPEVFRSYGFKWEDIATITKEEMDNYQESYLIREVNDPRVYYLEDGRKRWINSIESFYVHGMNWDAIHVINITDASSYLSGETVSPTSNVKPPSGTIPAIPAQSATSTPPSATSTPPVAVPTPSASSTPPTATSTEPIVTPTPTLTPTPVPGSPPAPSPTPIPTHAPTATTTPTSASTTSPVAPIFSVSAPGGTTETLLAGTSYTIRWYVTGTASTTRISLYSAGSFKEILAAEVLNTGREVSAGTYEVTWTWTIPSNFASGSQYKIRAFNLAYPNSFGEGYYYFTIVAPATASGAPPIGYWKFDGNGNNEIAGSPNATTVASAVFQSTGGKFGGYAYVPSSADSLKISYNKIFDLPNSFTIEFWFRQRSNQSFNQNLVYKGNPPNNYNFNIFRNLWNQANNGAVIAGSTAAGTGYWHQVSNQNEPPHNAWHHVVYTKTTSGAAYYIDAILIHSRDYAKDQSMEYSGPVKTPNVFIAIGNPAPDTDFDNLRIYDRALDYNEVFKNYLE